MLIGLGMTVLMAGRAAPPPVLTSIDPDLGDIDGNHAGHINVVGTDFVTGALLVINGVDCTTAFVSSTALQAYPPSNTAGTYDVKVRNPDAQESNVLTGAYEAFDPASITAVDTVLDSKTGTTGTSPITAWVDRKRSASYTNIGTPVLTTNGFGTPIPSVDLVPDEGFTGSPRTMASGFSVFWVGSWTSSQTGHSISVGACALTVVGDDTQGIHAFGAAAGELQLLDFVNGGYHVRGSSLNDGVVRLHGWTVDQASNDRKAYSGTTQLGTTITGGSYTGTTAYRLIGIGNGSVDGWDGKLGAVIAIGGVPSGATLTKIHKWARLRYGAAA